MDPARVRYDREGSAVGGTAQAGGTGRREGRAYIGSFTTGGGRGITIAAVDPESGALTPRSAVDGLVNPSCLALGGDGGVLYAVSDADPGGVAAFRAADGELRALGPVTGAGGSGPTHLSVRDRLLLTAHYTSGSVGALPLASDGRLGGPPAVLAHEGSGPDTDRQAGPHAHQVVPAPGGRWVLSVDLGTDSVRVCTAEPGTGALRLHAETVLRRGSGPRHLAFHPDGTTVYVLHELEPLLTVCRWDPAAGRLAALAEVAVDTDGTPDGARAYPSVVRPSADGRFLWVAVRGSNRLLTYSLAAGADAPRLASTVDCGGSWPRDLVTDPSERRLYVANEWSGDVTWFDVDPESGALRRAGAVEVPAAACVVFA
ncbi:lactonase family protein [Streptomyces sp. CC77]|uniref:lactonase family protein n=1 Tax=Streptomyces sp. CC77 TaxID=1906739 RepID=UPI0009A10216|nr:lactonase family protein [Streptomyces sp. CC77]